MPLSDNARLQSAALQLAASFEYAFPLKTRSLFEWRFTVDCGWYDEIGDGAFGPNMFRWGAFLWAEKRFPIFELMIEEIIELKAIVVALENCRSALRAAVRGSSRVPREVLVYADLFRQLRRSRWAHDGYFDMGQPPGKLFDPDDENNGVERTARVVVRRPNVSLVREMARVVEREPPIDSRSVREANTAEAFVPTPVQAAILCALDRRAMRTKELVNKTFTENSQLFRNMKELRERGMVNRHTRLGFYRPDRPPVALTTGAENHRRGFAPRWRPALCVIHEMYELGVEPTV